jgi:hypothetical protein
LVNVTADGNSLQKTAGCGGCGDAGAVSQQRIASGAGYVEFTASETDTLRFIGLAMGTGGTDATAINFAFRLQLGRAEVREGGVYRSETTFSTGDSLRISVTAGAITYAKNGMVFYSSPTSAAYPLTVSTSLYDLAATIKAVVIATSPSSGLSSTPPARTSATPVGRAVPRPGLIARPPKAVAPSP